GSTLLTVLSCLSWARSWGVESVLSWILQGPSVSVEGESNKEFALGCSFCFPQLQGILDVPGCQFSTVNCSLLQRSVDVSDSIPRTSHVIGHDMDVIDSLCHLSNVVSLFDFTTATGNCDGEKFPLWLQCLTEFFQESCKVLFVLWFPSSVTCCRIFPVHVESVEFVLVEEVNDTLDKGL